MQPIKESNDDGKPDSQQNSPNFSFMKNSDREIKKEGNLFTSSQNAISRDSQNKSLTPNSFFQTN